MATRNVLLTIGSVAFVFTLLSCAFLYTKTNIDFLSEVKGKVIPLRQDASNTLSNTPTHVLESDSLSKKFGGSETSLANLRHVIINGGLLDYDVTLRQEFERLVELQVEDTDPQLIAFTRQLIDPPSNHMNKYSRPLIKTPQVEEVDQLLNMKGGFFFDCGALDGERSSNSVWLEKNKGWTGLLVEMDPYFYTQIRGKNRHSYSINACLSTTRHPQIMYFKESTGGHGKLLGNNAALQSTGTDVRRSPCIPINTLLLAVNRTRVDFLSLDVEGFEMPILKTVRWDLIDVRTIAVEYSHGQKSELRQYIESQGFKFVKDIHYGNDHDALYVDDFIFVKQ